MNDEKAEESKNTEIVKEFRSATEKRRKKGAGGWWVGWKEGSSGVRCVCMYVCWSIFALHYILERVHR